jgi:hypothetical protein
VVADHSTDPVAWERTLDALYSFLAFDLVYPTLADGDLGVRASNEEVRALADGLAAEYHAFFERYRDTPREPPALDP